MADVTEIFTKMGGEFVASPSLFAEKLFQTKAFLFDWDGVFNDGSKFGDQGSVFSETDAMGTNLLRFGWWLQHKKVPPTGIITGENNPASQQLAMREHFDDIFLQAKNKGFAFDHFLKKHALKPQEICYLYDDVLDLPIAEQAGLRVLVNRKGSPLFRDFVRRINACDYITFTATAFGAVRESCELLIGGLGKYDEVVSNRKEYSSLYQSYLKDREMKQTSVLFWEAGEFRAG